MWEKAARAELRRLEEEAAVSPEAFRQELEPAEALFRQTQAAYEEVRHLPSRDPRRSQAENDMNGAEIRYELTKSKQKVR